MTSDVQVLVRRGSDIAEWFDTVAHLRAKVFRSFPYLYEGDIEYEKHYLSMYARSADSLLVLALADDLVVGASTGLPLGDAEPAFQVPFADRGVPMEAVFYCGESVLLPAFRGLAWATASLTNAKRMLVRWAACSGHRLRRWIEQTTILGVLPTTAVMIPSGPVVATCGSRT